MIHLSIFFLCKFLMRKKLMNSLLVKVNENLAQQSSDSEKLGFVLNIFEQ